MKNLKAREWALLIGTALVGYLGFKAVWWGTRLKLPQQPQGQGALPAGAPPPPPPAPPQPLGGAQVNLVPGKTYFGTLSVGFPASMGASKSKVASLANEHGFTNVGVDDKRPAWWPGQVSGDYYVSATYKGAPMTTDKHLGPGVDIAEAFVL